LLAIPRSRRKITKKTHAARSPEIHQTVPGVSQKIVTNPNYLLDNRKVEAGQRFAALSAIYDPISWRQFHACGMAAGWHCWEVGAGGVALIQKLAEWVGPTGRILATDIDPLWAQEAVAPNLEVRRHDVAREALPAERFDLVHARLLLVHIPERAQAFQHLISVLKPGGWLVVEDADPLLQPLCCIDVSGPAQELANRIRTGFRALLAERGVNLAYGRTLPGLFRNAGLQEVAAEAYFPVSLPECVPLEIATINHIRNDLLAHKIATHNEIEQHLRNVRSGLLDIAQPPLISVRGRKAHPALE
jgi:SAM-dependent methyltransferase